MPRLHGGVIGEGEVRISRRLHASLLVLTPSIYLAYAAKTTDDDYLQKSGLEDMVGHDTYRKDLVAGGLGDVLSQREC